MELLEKVGFYLTLGSLVGLLIGVLLGCLFLWVKFIYKQIKN